MSFSTLLQKSVKHGRRRAQISNRLFRPVYISLKILTYIGQNCAFNNPLQRKMTTSPFLYKQIPTINKKCTFTKAFRGYFSHKDINRFAVTFLAKTYFLLVQ